MPKREIVLIVSRVLALWLFCWGLSLLTYIPQQVQQLMEIPGSTESWHTYARLSVEADVFRVVALLAASFLFYECGPRVQRFLLPAQEPIKAE